MRDILLVSAAGLFILIIIYRFIRAIVLGNYNWKMSDNEQLPEINRIMKRAENPAKAREALREIESIAVQKHTKERGVYYFSAGEIALNILKRPNVAVRLYLKALRNDPMCDKAFDRLTEVLIAQKKTRRLEHVCWNLLARMDEEMVGSGQWVRCWVTLTSVYAKTPRYTERVDAIRKMLTAFETDDDN